MDPVLTSYCTVCACLEGGNGGGGGIVTIATISPSICEFPQWVSDGYCDDYTNTAECEYDGGDCCLEETITVSCQECICHDSGMFYTISCSLKKLNIELSLRIAITM